MSKIAKVTRIFLATLFASVRFNVARKILVTFCDFCGHLMGLLCPFTFQVFSFAKFVTLVILAIFASVRFNVARKILVTFAIFADISWAFFAFLPFKSFILLKLLLLLFLRYLLACVLTLQEKFLLLLRFLRTSHGPSLPFYLSSLFFC